MTTHEQFTLPPASQHASLLFHLPVDIREDIFRLALIDYPDPDPGRQYLPTSPYTRPDLKSRGIMDVGLLASCQAAYAETWWLPFQLRRHRVWLSIVNKMPPDQMTYINWPLLQRQAQRVAKRNKDDKPVRMDSLQVFVCPHGLQSGDLGNLLLSPYLHPRLLTITIRHADWTFSRHLHLESHWVLEAAELLSSYVEELRLELEDIAVQKEGIEAMAKAIRDLWSFKRDKGETLYANTTVCASATWSRPIPLSLEDPTSFRQPDNPNIYKATVTFQPRDVIESLGGSPSPHALSDAQLPPAVRGLVVPAVCIDMPGATNIDQPNVNPFSKDSYYYDKRFSKTTVSPIVESPTFNIDSTVAALTTFYEIVAQANYGNKSCLRYPPKEGWPYLRREAVYWKSKRAVELLRRIPYFRRSVYIAPCAASMDPLCQRPRGEQEERYGVAEEQANPYIYGPDIIELCKPVGGDTIMLLNVARGTIWWRKPIEQYGFPLETVWTPDIESPLGDTYHS